MKLLGRGGTEMLPLLNEGAAGIKQLTDLQRRGIRETVLSTERRRWGRRRVPAKASAALWGQLKIVGVVIGESIARSPAGGGQVGQSHHQELPRSGCGENALWQRPSPSWAAA